MLGTVLSLMVLAAIGLLGGAYMVWRRGNNPRQALLMVVLALVAVVNVAIWTVPDSGGESPLEKVEQLDPEAG